MRFKKAGGSYLILLFSVTYMVSYITRINFGAIISEMVAATGISSALLSLSVTGSFITYGAGQIISGILGDRFSPRNLIALGIAATSLMNACVPLCKTPYLMLLFWCINGFAQSFMWPPLVKLMAANFKGLEYDKATVKISWGSSFGTVAVYLFSPLLISAVGWQLVFFVSASLGAIMLFFWLLFCPNNVPLSTDTVLKADQKSHQAGIKILFSPLMLALMLAIVLMGMLRDGVTTWMPSYISQTYSIGTEVSILTGVVMPVFSIICFQITAFIHRIFVKNPITCAAIIYAVGAAAAIILYFVAGKSPAASVSFFAVLTASMHGVNLMLICMVPRYFNKFGNVSTVSGVLNSCTYIGSAVSTFAIALISEKFSWSVTLLIWFVTALIGTSICFACAKGWKKKMGV